MDVGSVGWDMQTTFCYLTLQKAISTMHCMSCTQSAARQGMKMNAQKSLYESGVIIANVGTIMHQFDDSERMLVRKPNSLSSILFSCLSSLMVLNGVLLKNFQSKFTQQDVQPREKGVYPGWATTSYHIERSKPQHYGYWIRKEPQNILEERIKISLKLSQPN